MKIIDIISEARKNPKLNPKLSINSQVIDAYDDAEDLENVNTRNAFVSFTQIDKLGINPGSTYKTPLGIYAYPAEYVKKRAGHYQRMSALPFAGKSPYANIFSVKGNIIDLNRMDPEPYKLPLANFWMKTANVPLEEAKNTVSALFKKGDTEATASHIPGGVFWYVTYRMANILSDIVSKKASIIWNSLFRSLGIDGFVDMGSGIIHTSEQTQAVFFSINAIDKVKRIENKYSPEYTISSVNSGKDVIEIKETMKNMDFESLKDYLISYPYRVQWIPRLPKDQVEELQLVALRVDSEVFSTIKNPSERVQLYAVSANYRHVVYIKAPSEAVALKAISVNANALEFIDHQTPAMQIAAVNKNPYAIEYVNNPSEELIVSAIKAAPNAFRALVEKGIPLSEQAKITAVTARPAFIRYIPNPSETLQLIAVNKDGRTIKYISDPSEKAYVVAIMNDPTLLSSMDPPDSVLINAINLKPTLFATMLYYGFVPSEAVQSAAINKSPQMYNIITNPSPAVTQLYKRLTNANN